MDVPTRKQAIRRETVERILALEPGRRAVEEADLAARFASLPGLDAADWVLLYASAFPEELATRPLMRQVLERGKRLVCPRVDRPARCLRLYELVDIEKDFTRGALGIPEPRKTCPPVEPGQVDWVLVPGLAFDARGYRLGRGAGYYDRLLPTLRGDVPRWALILDCQWVDGLPVEWHDVSLDGIVSPSRIARRIVE